MKFLFFFGASHVLVQHLLRIELFAKAFPEDHNLREATNHMVGNAHLSILPTETILLVCTYITGERRKGFAVQGYKTDLLNLLKAVPGFWTLLKRNSDFHRVIRDGIEETILFELRLPLKRRSPDDHARIFKFARLCLGPNRLAPP